MEANSFKTMPKSGSYSVNGSGRGTGLYALQSDAVLRLWAHQLSSRCTAPRQEQETGQSPQTTPAIKAVKPWQAAASNAFCFRRPSLPSFLKTLIT
jgi:hypothetical protein